MFSGEREEVVGIFPLEGNREFIEALHVWWLGAWPDECDMGPQFENGWSWKLQGPRGYWNWIRPLDYKSQ